MDTTTIATEEIDDGVRLIAPAGEHDLHSAPELGRALREALDVGPVVLDLSGATFVDSSILGQIVDVHRRAEESGRPFAVVLEPGSAAGVTRVLEVTGLDRTLGVLPDRAAAIDSVRSRPAAEDA